MQNKPSFTIFYILLAGLYFTLPIQALELEDFLADLQIKSVSISPNGKYLAAVKSKGNISYVTVRDLDSPNFAEIGYWESDIKRPSGLKWANAERLLVDYSVPVNTNKVARLADGDKDFDITDYAAFSRTIAVDPDGSNAVNVFNDKNDAIVESNLSAVHHYLPDDPDHVIMRATNGGNVALFKVNLNTGESELTVRGGRYTYAFISDDSGNVRYRADFLYIRRAVDIFEYRDGEKWEKIERIYLDDDDGSAVDINGLLGLYQDRLVFLQRNKDTGFNELLIRDSETGKNEVLVSLPDQDVIGAVQAWRSSVLAGYAYENGDVIEIQYFDEALQAHYNRIRTAVRTFTPSEFIPEIRSPDSRWTLVSTRGANDPGTVFLHDAQTNQLILYGTRFEKLIPQNLATPAVTSYQTRDEAVVRSYILLPQGFDQSKKAPMVIMPHGGPHARDYARFNGLAQLLANQGYIVFQPNFRGSTGYGKAFLEKGFREWDGIMMNDIEDGVHFMVRKGFANPEKICIVGGSFGGYAALMGIVKTPDLYRCAISINGVSDVLDIAKEDEKLFRRDKETLELLQHRIGDPSKDKERLIRQSPITHVEKAGAPVLLIAGTEDQRVTYAQSRSMVNALKKANKEVEYLEVDGAGHGIFNRRQHAELVYREVVTFLGKHLN